MWTARTRASCRVVVGALLILLAGGASAARAQERLTGKYRCVRLEVEQKAAPCQSPPLILHDDGSYQIWGEEGTYELVQGRWLILEHSRRRGLGNVVNPREIVFEYRVGDKRCKVTFRRIFEPPPGYSLS